MSKKVFKTTDQLIGILSDRGVDLDTPELKNTAKQHLQHEGYYNLINGYKNLFLLQGESDKYKAGTTVDEIYALFVFDQNIRETLFRYILPVERNIKTLIANQFSQKYGHDNYLIYKNFDTSRRDSEAHITSMLSEIQRQISNRSSDRSISHFLNTYGYIPLWVLNNILSLGNISKFYYNMKQQDRQSISKTFGMMDYELETCLKYLTDIRNCCAHSNRLYCFKSDKKVMFDTLYHGKLDIPKIYKIKKVDKNNKDNKEYKYGKRDLFAAVIILKLLIDETEFKKLCSDISECIDIIRPKLSVLSIDDILNEMGFPNNWKELSDMKNI